ncbi:TonB-dependent receptor [Terrimonas pollutisoli]|uniref:TonB-dependent receptor n=1 Tax=Terrimonas pollutisoli TaxID=3034147 RepID=UPI0023EC803F|nr:TonB-dependent receptor [Terrimonas sp. H1YJ31]
MQKISMLLMTVIVLALNISAQLPLGSIKGKITTTDGKPAAMVTVSLKNTKKNVLSGDDGRFEIRNIQPGSYEIELSLVGYENILKTVTVAANKTETVELRLEVSDKQLQEVIVTTGRRGYNSTRLSPSLRIQTPLLETPQNIQVISNKVLVDQQVVSMFDGVIRNVSGAMRLEHWGDLYTNINMRGSRASAFRNGMNAITSYWSPLTEDMSFVDHIEFVKGPSGFMMAVGDPAGIYNVVTKKPTGITKGEVGFTTGSFDLYRATIDLDGKLDKEGKLLYRLNAAGQTKNSFRAYEYSNRYSIAPVISYKLDDKTTFTVEYVLQKVKMSDVGTYYVFSTEGYGVLPHNFTTAERGLDPTHVTDQSITLNMQHKFNDNWKLTAQAAYFDYKQKGSDLWPAFVSADSMVRGVGIWDAASAAKYGQVFLNGDFQTGKIHHRILTGIDVNDKEYMADWNQFHALDTDGSKFSLHNPVYGSPANGYPEWDRSTSLRQRAGQYGYVAQTYTGVYIQDELGFFDNKLRLTLAGRYSYVKNNDYGTEADAEKVTPRIGASFSVDRETSFYALYDQSFLPQTGFKRDGSSVKPLTGNNMELGIKRDWFGGKWGTTLAVYRILKNNENSTDPSDATGRYIVQLGQTRSQGIELDLRGEIIKGLTATVNYALTDSRITKADSSAASQATIGNKVPGYAKHTANAWLNYKISDGALKGLGFSAGFSYLAERSTWTWAGASKQAALPDYSKIDGGIFWEQDKLRIALNIFNVTDKFLYSGSAYSSYYYWQAEPGRNWRLGINYRF